MFKNKLGKCSMFVPSIDIFTRNIKWTQPQQVLRVMALNDSPESHQISGTCNKVLYTWGYAWDYAFKTFFKTTVLVDEGLEINF